MKRKCPKRSKARRLVGYLGGGTPDERIDYIFVALAHGATLEVRPLSLSAGEPPERLAVLDIGGSAPLYIVLVEDLERLETLGLITRVPLLH